MELAKIRTRSDFIQWITENKEVLEVKFDQSVEDIADWFIAISQAKMVSSDYRLKDIAYLFLDGVKGIKEDPEEAHREYWGSYFEDADLYREEGKEDLALGVEEDVIDSITEDINDHFGVRI